MSLIQSNYEGFGSGLVIPSLGFGLQDRGSLFNMREGAANQYMPGKRPFHSLTICRPNPAAEQIER